MAVAGNVAIIPILSTVAFINIFFGYWRSNVRRLSLQWLLAVHIPVPIAIGLRLTFLGWSWVLLPAFVAAFFLGQFGGGQIRRILKKARIQLSSFLILDLLRVSARLRRDSQGPRQTGDMADEPVSVKR